MIHADYCSGFCSVFQHRNQNITFCHTHLVIYLGFLNLLLVAVLATHNACGWNSNQGDHLSGKPGNVREFKTCQGNLRDYVNSQGNVREKILSGKSVSKLFITNWIFAFNSIFFLLASLTYLYSHTFKFAVAVSHFCLSLLFKLH